MRGEQQTQSRLGVRRAWAHHINIKGWPCGDLVLGGVPSLPRAGYQLILRCSSFRLHGGWLPWLLELYGQYWPHEETNVLLVLNQNSDVNYPVYLISQAEIRRSL